MKAFAKARRVLLTVVALAAAGTLAEVPKAVVAADYLRPAVRFLKFLPQAMEVAQQDPTLEYYGDGPVDAGSGRRSRADGFA